MGDVEKFILKSLRIILVIITKRKPNAKILSETSLMFLVHPTIDENSMNSMQKQLKGTS